MGVINIMECFGPEAPTWGRETSLLESENRRIKDTWSHCSYVSRTQGPKHRSQVMVFFDSISREFFPQVKTEEAPAALAAPDDWPPPAPDA